jgi:RNA polymerase sigma-70 factor, ECF subfamily
VANLSGLEIKPTTRGPDTSADGSDADLVARAKQNRAAFAPLYARYADPVYRYSLRRLGTREAAEDATAQVFVKVLGALTAYRDNGPSFRSWLFAIAHNVLVDIERGRRPVQGLNEAALVADRSAGPEDEAISAETRRDVRALLAAVAPDQRRVLELRLAGLSTAEIADALGRPPAAIRGIQFRAEIRLRSLLGVGHVRTGAGNG